MLMAERDKYKIALDVKNLLMRDGIEEDSSVKIAAVFGESAFYDGVFIESNGLENNDIYVDLGYFAPEKYAGNEISVSKRLQKTHCPTTG